MIRLAPYSKGAAAICSGLATKGSDSRCRQAQPTTAMRTKRISTMTTLFLPNENNFKISSYKCAALLQ